MLTDVALRNLKPKEKPYKVADRNGLYVYVLKPGGVSFRYSYTINGSQDTLALGRYGAGGLKLTEARELLEEAKRSVAAGCSPARHKAADALKQREDEAFAERAEEWLSRSMMAESTRDMQRSVYERDLVKPFGRLQLGEVTPDLLRSLCDRIQARGAHLRSSTTARYGQPAPVRIYVKFEA